MRVVMWIGASELGSMRVCESLEVNVEQDGKRELKQKVREERRREKKIV